MRKMVKIGIAAAALSAAMSMSAFATGWVQSEDGRWWYGTNYDNSQWASDGWWGIYDDNAQGVKFYYFDGNGYMLSDTSAPDGREVNASGELLTDGEALVFKTDKRDAEKVNDIEWMETNVSKVNDTEEVIERAKEAMRKTREFEEKMRQKYGMFYR